MTMHLPPPHECEPSDLDFGLSWPRAVLALVTIAVAVWFGDGDAAAWVDVHPNPRFALAAFSAAGLFLTGGYVILRILVASGLRLMVRCGRARVVPQRYPRLPWYLGDL